MPDEEFNYDAEEVPPVEDSPAQSRPSQPEITAETVQKMLDWFKQDMEDKLQEKQEHIDELYRRLGVTEEDDAASLNCSLTPTTIGAASEGSETADTTEYDKSTGAPLVKLYVVTRVVYNEAGDEKLYAFARYVTFQACHVGPETRYEVDVPTDCDTPP